MAIIDCVQLELYASNFGITKLKRNYIWEYNKNNTVALSPRANYTDWATATCRRNLVPTVVDRGVSRGQRGESPTVVRTKNVEYHFSKIRHRAVW
jgi:hypothetical protein